MPGNIDQLGPWDPGKQAMTNRGDGIWEATVAVLDGTDIQYKYTRGTWETVEDWGSITGTNNRDVAGGRWHHPDHAGRRHLHPVGRPGVPDNHLAIQYWRDPVVVSTAATATTVTVKFQRDIQPVGADFAGSVAVAGQSGTVAETDPGTLVWTRRRRCRPAPTRRPSIR